MTYSIGCGNICGQVAQWWSNRFTSGRLQVRVLSCPPDFAIVAAMQNLSRSRDEKERLRDRATMSKWILYILECHDNTLYTGITTDLAKRIKRHNEGRASKYTRSKWPVKLVYQEEFDSESSARKREIEVKKLSRKNKMDLIQSKMKRNLYPSVASFRRNLGMNFTS